MLIHPIQALRIEKYVAELGGSLVYRYLLGCPDCGRKRWVSRNNWRRMKSLRCLSCSAKKNVQSCPRRRRVGHESHLFKRGWTLNDSGYKIVSIPKESPFRQFADAHGRIREHRLVMIRKIGRALLRHEHIHHINGDKLDNRIENLEILPAHIHSLVTALEKENRELRAENERLRNAS